MKEVIEMLGKKFKDKIDTKPFKTTITILIIILVLGIGFRTLAILLPDIISESASDEINAYLDFFIVIATICLAIIAYSQLDPIKKDLEGGFLLNIFKEWTSEDITKARREIDKIYKSIENSNITPKGCALSIKIEALNSDEEDDQKKYYQIVNFLNLLEFIGHFYCHKYISIEQVDDLIGSPLIHYGNELGHYMFSSQENSKTFSSFKILYEALLEKRNKET